MNTYVQLPEIVPGAFFSSPTDALRSLPPGFADLSSMVESLAVDVLKNSSARLTFRLFILRHDTEYIEREGMKPIYSTTCTVAEKDDVRRAVVLSREWDEDFANCIKNGGCRRCGVDEAE